MGDTRALAHIEQIKELAPIEGADKIVVATVLGWKVVVPKDQFEVGDKVVYIEIDSRCPKDAEWAQFLEPRGYKVKTIKLRGQISQGLIQPLSILPAKDYKIGQNVTDILKIEKIQDDYSVPEVSIEQRIKSKRPNLFKKKWFKYMLRFNWFKKLAFKIIFRKTPKQDAFPTKFEYISKTDETRIQNAPEYLLDKTPMIVTEKLEGTSATYILERLKFNRFKFYVCSRNICQTTEAHKCFYDENVYWLIANKLNIKAALEKYLRENKNLKYVCLQGEITGTGICGNIYQLDGYDFHVFNFIDNKVGRYGSLEAKELVKSKFDLKFVPILDSEYILPDTVEEMLDYADGASTIRSTMREGVVIRSKDGKTSFKAVSNKYLLKKNQKG